MIDIQKLFSASRDVCLPAGRHVTTKDIIIPEGGSLTGVPGTIIKFMDGRKNICMNRPNCRLQGLRVETGGVLITTSHTVCKDVTVSANGAVAYNLGGAFKVHVASNQTLEDHIFENCTAIDCGRHGFLNEGDHQGANKVIRNQRYTNCKAISCGAKIRMTDWYVGFDFNECPTNILTVENILVENCHAEGCLESGFHLEQAPIVKNVIFKNCTSTKNGLIKRGVQWEYGAGFYVRNGVTLENCVATNNHFGIFVAIGKGNPLESAVIKGCKTTGNAANRWIKGGKDFIIQAGCQNVHVDSTPGPIPVDPIPTGNFVTVGHGKADFVCDGKNDVAQIIAASRSGKQVKVISDGIYLIGSPIVLGDGAKITALTPDNPPTFKRTCATTIIDSGKQTAFDISYLKLDGGNFCGQWDKHYLVVLNACKASRIDHCEFYNIPSYGVAIGSIDAHPQDGPVGGRGYEGDNTISITNNVFHDIIGFPITVVGKTDPINQGRYCEIASNYFYGCKPQAGVPFPAILTAHANIHHNVIVGHGKKGSAYDSLDGCGIGAARSLIKDNVVFGCSNSGIVPSCTMRPTRFNPVEPNCQNDCYCTVSGNVCKYNGANGIDFWYSDYTSVIGNICNDNGQHTDDRGIMDTAGIDVADHTHDTVVSNNTCTNEASIIKDTLAASASSGAAYITVTDITKWYETWYGRAVPRDGLRIAVGGRLNRIERVDIANKRLYLIGGLQGGPFAAGTSIQGINNQNIGINLSDNWQSLGGHRGSGNRASGNITVQIGALPGFKTLPNTNIT